MVYCFEAIITSWGFHVYKKRTWSTAKVGDEVKVEVESNLNLKAQDSYCSIKAKDSILEDGKWLFIFLVKYCDMFIFPLNKKVGEFMQNWRKTLSDSVRKSRRPTITQVWIPRQMCHGYSWGIWGKFLFFEFHRGFRCKWWRWRRNRKTLLH